MVRAGVVGIFLNLFLFSSCSENRNKALPTALTYFDVKSYFEQEAVRLSQEKPLVFKEIDKNTDREAKKINIDDWNKEFSLFIKSDINKPSWTSSYNIESNNDTIVYSALYSDLRTKEIKILKKADKLIFISIKNEAINKLYKSHESLFYFPDSVYRIIKDQQVRFIGDNHYQITGKFME